MNKTDPFLHFSATNDPFPALQTWFNEAQKTEDITPDAAQLATVDSAGMTNIRTVLIKEITPAGLVFYTNFKSQKGIELVNAKLAEHSNMYLIKSEPNYFGRERTGFGIECKLNVPTTGYEDLPLVITEEGLYVAGFHHWGEGNMTPPHRLTVRGLADEIADGIKSLIEG